jgi:hypothetical protein
MAMIAKVLLLALGLASVHRHRGALSFGLNQKKQKFKAAPN